MESESQAAATARLSLEFDIFACVLRFGMKPTLSHDLLEFSTQINKA